MVTSSYFCICQCTRFTDEETGAQRVSNGPHISSQLASEQGLGLLPYPGPSPPSRTGWLEAEGSQARHSAMPQFSVLYPFVQEPYALKCCLLIWQIMGPGARFLQDQCESGTLGCLINPALEDLERPSDTASAPTLSLLLFSGKGVGNLPPESWP